MTNHAFTDAINLLMEKKVRNMLVLLTTNLLLIFVINFFKDIELKKNVLNNVYFQYRHIVNHSTGLTMDNHNIEQVHCYACAVSNLVPLNLFIGVTD